MLLVEYTLLDKLQVINETTESGQTRLKLRGRFQKCDEQNNNGRIYPRKILESQVQKIQEKINDRSLVGALDHPPNDAIHLSQASHLITGLSVDKSGDVIGECEILSTPNGKIVQSLINDGVKIGISSRGVGSVSEGREGKIVNEDFKLITFDLVSDPSTKGAYPELTESIRENSQRAQAIVSKHKRERVLTTLLESKINQKLLEAKKPIQLKPSRSEGKPKKETPAELLNKTLKRPPLKKDGENIESEIGRSGGRGSIGEPDSKKDSTEIYGKSIIEGKKKKPKLDATGYPEGFFDKQKPAGTKRQNSSTNIIGDTLIEALKKVCWGDRYDEGAEKDQERAERLQQTIEDNERKRLAAGGAGQDQSKRIATYVPRPAKKKKKKK